MAAPTFVAAGTLATGTTSLSIPYFAGLAADDIAMVLVNAQGTSPAIGTITDFTSIAQQDYQATVASARIAWKRLTGGESANITCAVTNGDTSIGRMVGFRGVIASGTPYEGFDQTSGNSDTQLSDTIITTVADTLGVRFAGLRDNTTSTPPSGWDERIDDAFDGTNDLTISIDTKIILTASTEAATTRTISSDPWFTQTLALLPAAAGQPYDLHEGGVKFVNPHHGGQNFQVWRKALGWRKSLSGLLLPAPRRVLRPI